MVCAPSQGSENARFRCKAEVPLWVRCKKLPFFFGPPPKELQAPKPALFQVSVDVSESAVLGIFSRVAPYPGDSLCDRPEASRGSQ